MRTGHVALTVNRTARLPMLAWYCSYNTETYSAHLECGIAVEVEPTFFVEGCWAGEYSEGNIAQAESVFGSGGVVTPDGLTFVPASATTDGLFYSVDGPTVQASNSLAFLLAAIGDELDPAYTRYDLDNYSIVDGIDLYCRSVRTRRRLVRRLLYRNLVCDRDGVLEQDKPWPPRFPSFSSYESYLDSTLKGLFANARSSSRRRPMNIATTQSRGYDSTAVNALAARHGVDIAFTAKTSKGAGTFADRDANLQRNDDGSEIADTLGIPWAAIDRRRFERPFLDEHRYYSALDNPQDLNLLELNDLITPPALLLTGTLGELWYPARLWGQQPGFASSELRRGDLGMHGLSEVRLKYGYVQCAVPFIGARQRADIVAITAAPDMASWSIGGPYDRPIPRRIAESRGIKREMFGQEKMASVVEFAVPAVPLGEELKAEYLAYLRAEGIANWLEILLLPIVRRINARLWFSRYRYYIERGLERMGRRPAPSRSCLLLSNLNGAIFCFAVTKLQCEYRLARPASDASKVPDSAAR